MQANRFTLTKFLLQISNIDYSLLIGTLLDNIEMYLCLINLMIRMFESTILENESGKGFYSYDNLDFKGLSFKRYVELFNIDLTESLND